MTKKIILASASPRRKSIIEELNIECEIIPSPYIEVMDDFVFDYKKIEDLAYKKAKAVADETKEDALVIGADTVVVIDNTILGKPKDKEEAFKMLKNLSGREHFVVTVICITDVFSKRKKIVATTSYVAFEELTDAMIHKYIEDFNPLDKAGSYGIQELPEGFIKNVRGSFENIIGLCPKALLRTLSVFKHR